jgi:hypothetical protein
LPLPPNKENASRELEPRERLFLILVKKEKLMTRDQIRYNLGELEYLKWEAANDAQWEYEQLTDEEREELEEEAESERRAADLEAWNEQRA